MADSTRARTRRLLVTIRDMIAREATDAEDAKQLAYDVGYYLQTGGGWSRRVSFGNPRSLPHTEYSVKLDRQMKNTVEGALSRARQAGQPATLTYAEWLETLDHFNYKCAYCKGPYDVLEHFIPIPHGGTTVNNCIPSCRSCNSKKGSMLPDSLHRCFSTSVINFVSSYLTSR